jgi:hypothetical protein
MVVFPMLPAKNSVNGAETWNTSCLVVMWLPKVAVVVLGP